MTLFDSSSTDGDRDEAASQTRQTIRQIARECLTAADGDWKRAATLMRERVVADRALFDDLMMPLIDSAIWDQVRKACHVDRQSYSVASNPDNTDGLHALARSYYDYPLSGGVKLGDATRAKLAEEIAMRRALAESNTRNADFLAAICNKVTGPKRVREAITDEQLTKLARKHGL